MNFVLDVPTPVITKLEIYPLPAVVVMSASGVPKQSKPHCDYQGSDPPGARQHLLICGVPSNTACASSGRSGDLAGDPILCRHTPPRYTSSGVQLENLTNEYSPIFPLCSG
jgi:hypothetical protein